MESAARGPTKIDRLKAKLDVDSQREQQLAADVKKLTRSERENAKAIVALEKVRTYVRTCVRVRPSIGRSAGQSLVVGPCQVLTSYVDTARSAS